MGNDDRWGSPCTHMLWADVGARDCTRVLPMATSCLKSCVGVSLINQSFAVGKSFAVVRGLPPPGFSVKQQHTYGSLKGSQSLPRFFSEELPVGKGLTVKIQGDEFWHMSKVLRLGIEDRVELFDGRGGIVEGTVVSMNRTNIDIAANEEVRRFSPVGPHWHLAAAFGSLKGGRGDWLVEKCTELGARSLMPLLTQRSPSLTEGRFDRWQRVVLAATKQCQRLDLMDLRCQLHVNSILSEITSFDAVLLADANAKPLAKVFPNLKNISNGLLLVGPEGDFTDKEKEALVNEGAVSVGLGPRRLRVETATMAILSAVVILSDPQSTCILTDN